MRCILCEEVRPISEVESHTRVCGGVVVECKGKEVGCSFSSGRNRVVKHEEKCMWATVVPVLVPFVKKISALETKIKEDGNSSFLPISNFKLYTHIDCRKQNCNPPNRP